jgi:HlyD family secretion protein
MSDASQSIFRSAAIERLSSPERLDQLIRITRPFDWAAVVVILLGLAVALTWSLIGRIPTQVPGEGILISDGGRVLDAVSAVTGRLASIEVAIGERVRQDQVVARVDQTETEQRHAQALAVLREYEREHAELVATTERELAAKNTNFAAQEAALNQVIAAAQQRAVYLTREVEQLEGVVAKGFITRRHFEDRRVELTSAQQRVSDARSDILRLKAQKLDLESQRERDRFHSEIKVNEARRRVEQLAGTLERDSLVISPINGRVIEIKVAGGAVLTVGRPVIAIETEGTTLQGLIFVPPDRGKMIDPGMEVHVEPTTVKREEFGAMVGRVVTISDFPVTPQGMAAQLHNGALVTRFSRAGAPYAAIVQLERNGAAASGYRWTSGPGPPVRLTTGTLVRADITVREQRPIDLVLPLARRLSGIGG